MDTFEGPEREIYVSICYYINALLLHLMVSSSKVQPDMIIEKHYSGPRRCLLATLKWFDSVLNDQNTLLRGGSHELVSVNRQPWGQSSPHELFHELPNCFLLLNNSSSNRKVLQGFISWIEKWKDKASPRWVTITLTDNSNTCLWVVIIQSHQNWAERKV